MAAIDKIYVSKFEDYLLFKEWCEKQPKIKDKYGSECSLSDYLFQYNSFTNGKYYPIFNAPYYIDAYLLRNCPFDFIQDNLKINYGYKSQEWIDEAYDIVMKRGGKICNNGKFHWLSKEDFSIVDGKIYLDQGDTDYDLIKDGKLYTTPHTNKKYKVGKSFKIVKCPQHKYNRPYKRKRWFVDVDAPEELGFLWYHSSTNTWDFSDEFVISEWTSSGCSEYKTIKAIKRAILKWKLPVGTIVTCTGRYVEDTYEFKVV